MFPNQFLLTQTAMQKITEILSPKLHKQTVNIHCVHRERLIEKLSNNYQSKSLSLVTALAGYVQQIAMSNVVVIKIDSH